MSRSYLDARTTDQQQSLGAAGDLHTLEDAGEVDFHRSLGQPEHLGNLAVGLALGQQFQHPHLGSAQAVALGYVASPRTAPGSRLAQARRQEDLAGKDLTQG